MEQLKIVQELKEELDKKFAENITVLDLHGLSPLADYFVIATASSVPQMNALTQTTEEFLHGKGLTLRHSEGLQSGKWVLLDFSDIIIHLFDKEAREYFNLERVWGDAKVV